MKKSIAVIASTGAPSAFPPAPHLLRELLGDKFDVSVVTRQTDPEPSNLSFAFQLIKTSLLQTPHVIHSFGTFGALLILIRRLWDAGSIWIHTPPDTDNKLEKWFHTRVISPTCDAVFELQKKSPKFDEQLSAADADIDRLKKLYSECEKVGVVMIAPLATQVNGGLQKQLRLQSQDLSASKYQVYLLQRSDPNFSQNEVLWSHVRIWQTWDPFKAVFPRSAWKKALKNFLFLTFGFLKLFRFRRRFEIIHAHQLYLSTTLGILARVILKKPLVVKVAASGYAGEKRALSTLPLYNFRLKSFSKIDRVIVLSHEMSSEMRELGFEEEKLTLIPNGVPIAQEVWTENPGQEIFKVFYSGRLTNDKCVEHILEAAQILAKRGYKLEVLLLGGPNYQQDTGPKLKAIAYSIRKNVEVKFFGEQADIGNFYRESDCFVLPSKSEGLSNSLLEAQSFGTPCIVSDILPNRFVVTDEVNGLLFRQGNPNDLAKKIEILIADKLHNNCELSKKLSGNSRKNIKDKFSTDHVSQKLQEVYEDLLRQ